MRHNGVLLALVAAVLLLGATSAYSSWVASQAHRNNCASRDINASTLHDVVGLAFAPPPDAKLTEADVERITAAENKIYARIDEERC